jgi:DNA repair protein RadC
MLMKSCLSDASEEELLAAIVPPAAVQELVEAYGTVPKILMNSHPDELARLKGIGPVKARQLQYLCELSKRLYQATAQLPPVIRTPRDVAAHMADMQHLDHEEFRIICTNTKNGILAVRTISKGILNASLVSPREVFHRAIRLMAAGVILVHNHPSGDPEPSPEDIALTEKMIQAGKILDISVLDHVVVGQGTYVSCKEKGLL